MDLILWVSSYFPYYLILLILLIFSECLMTVRTEMLAFSHIRVFILSNAFALIQLQNCYEMNHRRGLALLPIYNMTATHHLLCTNFSLRFSRSAPHPILVRGRLYPAPQGVVPGGKVASSPGCRLRTPRCFLYTLFNFSSSFPSPAVEV